MSYTQGPWKSIIPPSSCLTTRFIESESGVHIAKVAHMDYGSGDVHTDVSNAQLLALAPEMLEALKRAAPWLGKMIADGAHNNAVLPRDCERTLEMIEAVIAKAEVSR